MADVASANEKLEGLLLLMVRCELEKNPGGVTVSANVWPPSPTFEVGPDCRNEEFLEGKCRCRSELFPSETCFPGTMLGPGGGWKPSAGSGNLPGEEA